MLYQTMSICAISVQKVSIFYSLARFGTVWHDIAEACKGLSTNAPPCPALRCAALRRALLLVDLVTYWLIPEVRTNQRQSLQEARRDAAQHGAGQGRAVHLWNVSKGHSTNASLRPLWRLWKRP